MWCLFKGCEEGGRLEERGWDKEEEEWIGMKAQGVKDEAVWIWEGEWINEFVELVWVA